MSIKTSAELQPYADEVDLSRNSLPQNVFIHVAELKLGTVLAVIIYSYGACKSIYVNTADPITIDEFKARLNRRIRMVAMQTLPDVSGGM